MNVCDNKSASFWKRVPYDLIYKEWNYFSIEIAEGRDYQHEHPSDPSDGHVKTVGIMKLHIWNYIYSNGKVVELDSGFCVLCGLIYLRKFGVFGHEIIQIYMIGWIILMVMGMIGTWKKM